MATNNAPNVADLMRQMQLEAMIRGHAAALSSASLPPPPQGPSQGQSFKNDPTFKMQQEYVALTKKIYGWKP